MATHGSFINELGANSGNAGEAAIPHIVVGLGVTFFSWTDRSCGSVSRIEYAKDGTTIKAVYVKADIVTWEPWPSGYAKSILPNLDPNAPEMQVVLRTRKGKKVWMSGGQVVAFGRRDPYTDPSF